MKRYSFLSVICLLVLSLVLAGCSTKKKDTAADQNGDEKIVLKVGHSAKDTEPYHIGLEAMKEKLEELTDGKMSLEIYPNATIGDERQMVEAVQSGNLDLAIATNGALANFSEELIILDFPYLFDDWDAVYKALDGDLGKELSDNLNSNNLQILSFVSAGKRHIMNSEKPINSMDDLKGLKIRVQPSPVHIASYKAFGSNPTPMSYAELYTGIQQGVVDGAEAANTNYLTQKFYEIAKHWAQVEWAHHISELVVNDKWLKSLPEDQRNALQEAATYFSEVERQVYIESDEKAFKELEDLNVEITYPDKEPFRKAAEGVWEEFADKVGGMERIREISGRE